MTPAQVARASLRFADVLLSIAAEMRQADPCEAIIMADRRHGADIADLLRPYRDAFALPVGLVLVACFDVPADAFEAAGEVWRGFGERLRVEVAHG